ncbi:MAG: glycosyltransferase family 1 protein [Pseudomonadota bacterium]
MPITTKRIVIDGREFFSNKRTGIGRFLEGLIDALADSALDIEIALASFCKDTVPHKLKDREKVRIKEIPMGLLSSEKALSNLSRQEASFFISPYPKLPLLGLHCPAVHTIHDVLYLTHPAYKNRYKVFFDRFRLQMGLKKSSLTWYVSSWSLKETKEYIGFTGSDCRVRYNAIDEKFIQVSNNSDNIALKKYALSPGYILVIGNGSPHKNLGVLLRGCNQLERQIVFVGVSEGNQKYWKSRHPNAKSVWINHVPDDSLPAIIREAFCLAQPSTAEGYGYPPLEAMASGVPAVVSNIPVLVETTGGNALIADPNDPKRWIEIFKALADRDVYNEQIQKGWEWVKPLLGQKGWQKHISDIKELIREN